MIEGVIYRYKSPSGKYYIGQTIDERKRRWNFLNIETQYGGSKIEKARKKYGPENFEYTVLMKVTGDDPKEVKQYLNTLEIGFIRMYDSFKNGYNLTEGGDGSIGYKVTEETKEKLRKVNLGKHLDDEHRKKIGIGNSRKTRSEETRRKISDSLKGKVHWNDGRTRSEETRRKISESLKGNIPWNKGKSMSKEQKKKLSEVHKGSHRVYNPDGTYRMVK